MYIFKYHELEISEKGHVILSTNQELYNLLIGEDHDSFDDYIDPNYKQIYLENVTAAENKWFTAGIRARGITTLYCLKASHNKRNKSIHIRLASIDDLLGSHNYLADTVTAFKSQLELYDDVYFDYNPEAQTVIMTNTQAADFDAGLYSLEEIESMLCNKVSPANQERIKNFIGQVKSKTGRSTTRIEANLLNDDPSIHATILEARYVYFPSDKEHVVGHIHLEHKREAPRFQALREIL